METYHVLTAESQHGIIQTALVHKDDYKAEDNDPAAFFPPMSSDAKDHGTVDIDGRAVDMLPPILTDNC